jgi:hypothetical protein
MLVDELTQALVTENSHLIQRVPGADNRPPHYATLIRRPVCNSFLRHAWASTAKPATILAAQADEFRAHFKVFVIHFLAPKMRSLQCVGRSAKG